MAVYHILPESEPFSRRAGGAAALWVDGVVAAAGIEERTIVVCPAAEVDPDDDRRLPSLWVAPEMASVGMPPPPLRHPLLWPRRAGFYARLLRGFIARLQPRDVVYVHNRPELALAMVLAQQRKSQRNPVVLALYDSRLAEAPRGLARQLAANLARFVFPSEYLYRQANERHRLHMHASILPFGADETVFYPSPRRPLPATPVVGQPPQVLYVGPVAEGHGLHTLLDAMRLLARRGVEAELRVIERPGFCADGQKRRDGQDVDAYRRGLRAQRGTNARFEPYLGPAQVADAMRSAAVVCCPALEPEAFCTCSVESMACAVPVAASSTGAVPDVFTQGGGLLLPPGDPGALADALERLLGKTGLARIVGRDGRESFLRNYRWSIIASAYLDLVASLPRGERQLQAQTFQTGRLVR